jgi:anti-sigma-K factor RskA
MATDHGQWLERGQIYALGALDGQELNEFELHLASGCPICAACVRETRETLTLLHRSLPPETPPDMVKSRVMERITPAVARQTEKAKASWFSWNWWGVGIGVFATAAVAIVLTSNLKHTQNELERVKAQLAVAQNQAAAKDEQLQLLSSPEIRLVELKGLDAAPGAEGRFFWNPTLRGGLLVAKGLPQTPADKAYELWGITGNEPVAVGIFTVDEKGQARFNMPPLAQEKSFDKFAVTIEPALGVVKPTGPMVLLGSL